MKKHKTLFAAMCASLLLSGCGSRPDKITFAIVYNETTWGGVAERSLYVFDDGTGHYTRERSSHKDLEEQISDTLTSCDEEWDCSRIFAEAEETAYSFDFDRAEVSEAVRKGISPWTDASRKLEYYVLLQKGDETELMKIGEYDLMMRKEEGNLSSDIDELEGLCRSMDEMSDIENRVF